MTKLKVKKYVVINYLDYSNNIISFFVLLTRYARVSTRFRIEMNGNFMKHLMNCLSGLEYILRKG